MIKLDNIPKVRNLNTTGGNTAPNQFEIRMDGVVIFQSYESIICIIDYNNETVTLGHDWNYSNTTAKYLYQILRDYIAPVRNRKEVEKWLEAGEVESRFLTWKVKYDSEVV